MFNKRSISKREKCEILANKEIESLVVFKTIDDYEIEQLIESWEQQEKFTHFHLDLEFVCLMNDAEENMMRKFNITNEVQVIDYKGGRFVVEKITGGVTTTSVTKIVKELDYSNFIDCCCDEHGCGEGECNCHSCCDGNTTEGFVKSETYGSQTISTADFEMLGCCTTAWS